MVVKFIKFRKNVIFDQSRYILLRWPKARVSFWVRKRKKNLPPQILSATADLTFVVSPPLTLAVPGIPDFGEGNPKGRHVSVERRPKQGEDVLLKIRKYLPAQRGKNVLLG